MINNMIVVNFKHIHKPYVAVKKNEAGDYESIAGGSSKNYLLKRYDIVIEIPTLKVLKGKID